MSTTSTSYFAVVLLRRLIVYNSILMSFLNNFNQITADCALNGTFGINTFWVRDKRIISNKTEIFLEATNFSIEIYK